MSFGDVSKDEEQEVFEFRRLPATTYEYDVDTWTMLDVTIERNRDASVIT